MGKYKFINIAPYKFQLDVFIGDKLDFISFMETYQDKNEYYDNLINDIRNTDYTYIEGVHYFIKDLGKGIIYITKKPNTPRGYAICGHEVLHFVFDLFSYIGVNFIPGDSNESYTYLFEHIMTELLTFDDYNKL